MRTNNYQKICKRYIAVVLALSFFVSGIVAWQLRLLGKADTASYENPQSVGLSGYVVGSENKGNGNYLFYESDALTSNLQKIFDSDGNFTTQKKNDGRLLTDKSVQYLGDEDEDPYGIFESEKATFGVKLSVLGQDYTIEESGHVTQPVDVVFILDTSASMREKVSTSANSTSKMSNAVTAINDVANALMQQNPANRFGLVTFSNNPETFLEVGHYLPDEQTGKFVDGEVALDEITGGMDRENTFFRTESGVVLVEDDGSQTSVPVINADSLKNYGATWTQKGFYEAYKLLQKSATSRNISVPVGNTGAFASFTRQPIIILVTDGLPTLSSPTYDDLDNATCYGAAWECDIHGFYTIQTANYIKREVDKLYEINSKIYTFGMGVSGNYAQAVLEPSLTNVNKLPTSGYYAYWSSSYNDYYAIYTSSVSTYRRNSYLYSDIYNSNNGYREYPGFYLRKMLNNAADLADSYYTADRTTVYRAYPYDYCEPDSIPRSYFLEPVNDNAYLNDYNYADDSWLGQLTGEDIVNQLKKVLKGVDKVVRFPRLMQQRTNVSITDEIGSGMSVTSVPTLMYGNRLYQMQAQNPAVTNEDGNTITQIRYIISDSQAICVTPEDANGEPRKYKLFYQDEDNPGITAIKKVVTNADGQVVSETMTMLIPPNLVPTYYPDASMGAYVSVPPARLMYTVGLDISVEEQLVSMSPDDSPKIYFTNKSAITQFEPDEQNIYYKNNTSDDLMKNPAMMVTNSSSSVRETRHSVNPNIYIQNLGNNGLLKIVKQDNLRVTVTKVWNDYKTEHDGVEIKLYQKASNSEEAFVYGENGSYAPYNQSNGTTILNDDNEWKHLFILPKSSLLSGETVTYSYYIEETPVSRYSTNYRLGSFTGSLLQQTSIMVNGNNKTVLHLDKDMSVFVINNFEYQMPSTGGTGIFPVLLLGLVLITVGVILYIKYYGFNIRKGEEK